MRGETPLPIPHCCARWSALLPLVLPAGTPAHRDVPASGPKKPKGPLWRAFLAKRMMGLEPTTFCMASRRSSQLSYIRNGPRV